jgi:hypothetical protein
MRCRSTWWLSSWSWFLVAGATSAQEPDAIPLPTQTPAAPATEPVWSFDASVYSYSVPGDRNYVQPTVTADRDWLHLEARYNYEDLDTGSLWCGWNFAVGEDLALEITPMVGAVFGQTNGIAPGYRGTLGWWKLELSSESEYLIDTNESSDSFFYTWSEFTLAPTDWLRFGYAVQRTKVYETDFEIQRGFVVGIELDRLSFSAYVFNPDESEPTVVVSAGVSF